jgi:hypothetical protein
MNRLVMGDPVAEQVDAAHSFMHVPADSAPLEAGEGVAQAGKPE